MGYGNDRWETGGGEDLGYIGFQNFEPLQS